MELQQGNKNQPLGTKLGEEIGGRKMNWSQQAHDNGAILDLLPIIKGRIRLGQRLVTKLMMM